MKVGDLLRYEKKLNHTIELHYAIILSIYKDKYTAENYMNLQWVSGEDANYWGTTGFSSRSIEDAPYWKNLTQGNSY